MTSGIFGKIRRVVGTICVSAGVLAIANVETIWQEYHRTDPNEHHESVSLKKTKRWTLAQKVALGPAIDASSPNFKPLQSALSRSLEQDELGDENPFSHLANLDPLHEIIGKGVTKFRRETFRSPQYQGENGYDLVSYEVQHSDGSQSSILAYLERANATTWHNVGAPDDRITSVVFMVANGIGATYSSYRAGALTEQSTLTSTEAQTLISQRLVSGIPFLSVSR